MAYTTTDLYISPSDGWVLVSESPGALVIAPTERNLWWVAVVGSGAGAPAEDVVGLPMGRGEHNSANVFQTEAIAGDVYICVRSPTAEHPGRGTVHFGVIEDA